MKIARCVAALMVALAISGSVFAGELTLEQAVKTAIEKNSGLEAMVEAVEQSDRVLNQARSAYFPTLDYQFSITGYLDEDPSKASALTDPGEFTNTVSANYTLYDGGRREKLRAGKFGAEAAEMDYERALAELKTNVKKAFLGAYLSKSSLDVQSKSLEYYAGLKKEAKARFDEGLIPESDYLTFANAYDQAKMMEIQYERDYGIAVLALEGLTHSEIPEGTELVMGVDEMTVPDGGAEALVEEAYRNREDVRAARARVEALKAASKAVGALKRPTVAAGAAYSMTENALTDIDHNDDIVAVYAQVSLRLSDGGQRVQARLEKESAARQAEARLTSLKWKARSDVLEAIYRIDAAERRLEIVQGSVIDAEKNLDIVTKRYHEGLIIDSKVTDAELNLTRARLGEISEKVSLAIARDALALATGGMNK